MHIEIIPNRNSKPAILLRESYRDGKKVRKRTFGNISKLPMEQVDAIRRILKGEKLISPEDVFEKSPTTPIGRGMMKPPRRGHCDWESP